MGNPLFLWNITIFNGHENRWCPHWNFQCHVWLPEGNGRCCLPHIVYCICHERDMSSATSKTLCFKKNRSSQCGESLGKWTEYPKHSGVIRVDHVADIMKYILASTSTWAPAHSPKMSLSENGDTPSCSSLHQEIHRPKMFLAWYPHFLMLHKQNPHMNLVDFNVPHRTPW